MLFVYYFRSDILTGNAAHQLIAEQHSEIGRITERFRDTVIFMSKHANLLKELFALANVERLPELVREGLSSRKLLQIRVVSD